MWKLSFEIWGHRNTALHGRTVEEQTQIQNRELHECIEEAYAQYQNNSSLVAASAQSLFDQPLAQLLSRQRQVKLSWLRAVQVAFAYQQRETQKLKQQAARFFGKQRNTTSRPTRTQHQEVTPQETTPSRTLPTEDISTPERYNL